MTITFIIITYNSAPWLPGCLASLTAHRPPGSPVIVVDNASQDGSAPLARSLCPDALVLANQENRGYGQASNQALALTSTPYVALMNPDVRLVPQAAKRLVSFLEDHPRAAMVAPSLRGAQGETQPAVDRYPSALTHLLDRLHPLLPPEVRSRLAPRRAPPQGPRAVDWVMTSFALARDQALKEVHGFDPSIFLYGEDLDLCWRLRRLRWDIAYLPEVSVDHLGNPVWDKARLARVYEAKVRACRQQRNRRAAQRLQALILAGLALRAARLALTGDPTGRNEALALARGLLRP